jgi:hypothetical protein
MIIVLQSGMVETFAGIAVVISLFFSIIYFICLPICALGILSRIWKTRSRIVLFTVYFGVLVFAILYFGWMYFLFTFLGLFWVFSGKIPLTLILGIYFPLIYIGVAIFIRVINFFRSHSHVVINEGCSQPSGCKVEETK